MALPPPHDRVEGVRAYQPVCASFPGVEATLRSAFSQSSLFFFQLGQDCSQDVFSLLLEPNPACSQASPCPSLLCQSPYCLSWILLPLNSVVSSVYGFKWQQQFLGSPWHADYQRCRAQTLVLNPATHWLCDPGQITALSEPQFLHL